MSLRISDISMSKLSSGLKSDSMPHRFLIASLRSIFRAVLTISKRLTLPICLRFIFDVLGSFVIHSGTDEPDCRSTFAILSINMIR